ncbi:MAG: hypothetical protein ACYDEV_16215 [Acidiferrobacter sp.]
MWPEIPNHHALFVLILTGSALLLFSHRGRLPETREAGGCQPAQRVDGRSIPIELPVAL